MSQSSGGNGFDHGKDAMPLEKNAGLIMAVRLPAARLLFKHFVAFKTVG